MLHLHYPVGDLRFRDYMLVFGLKTSSQAFEGRAFHRELASPDKLLPEEPESIGIIVLLIFHSHYMHTLGLNHLLSLLSLIGAGCRILLHYL